VRVGVIGTGALGFHHARLLRRMPGVEFAGIYDKNPARAAEVAKQLETVAHPSLDALLERAEAIPQHDNLVKERFDRPTLLLQARRAGTPLPPGSRRGARWPARRRCSPRTQCAPQTPAAGVSGTAAAVFPRRRGNAPRLPGAKGYFNAAALRAGAGPGRGRSARGQWAAALMGAARACPVSQSRSSQCRRPPPLRCFFRCFPSCDCCADMRHNVIFCLGRKRREARRVKRGIRRTGAP